MLILLQGVDTGVRGVARSDEIGDNACRNPANKRTCEMSKLAKHVKCQERLKTQGTVWAFSPKTKKILPPALRTEINLEGNPRPSGIESFQSGLDP